MNAHPPQNKGFSLIELMATIVIMGILLSFALPKYHITIERNKAKKGRIDAEIFLAGLKNFYAVTDSYPNFTSTTNIPVSEINSTLGLNIIDTDFSFDSRTGQVSTADYTRDFQDSFIYPSAIAAGANDYYFYRIYAFNCKAKAGAPASAVSDCQDAVAVPVLACQSNATKSSENYCP